MARKSNLSAEDTRERLLDAAERLFASNGVAKTSLSDVAAAAGFTRGALYWHFAGKGELLGALFARFEFPLDEMARTVLGQPDPLRALRDYWVGAMTHLQHSERARRILEIRIRKCEYIAEYQEADVRVARWFGETLAIASRAFAEAEALGLLAPNASPASSAASLLGLLSGFGYLSVSLSGAMDFDSVAALEQFFDLVSARSFAASAEDLRDHAAA